ncbi:hypothetical protein IW249_006489 [Micromonospora vinacea]|uniref:DUF416 family protein n=1 Tax=Micromonospora vinacea TaxID=709878 RepID=A0ABS0KC62_9ACTN|nr:hypothetical protein [Micromonospora vinacea]MBG6106075.1 hypothetical protein [Micromonospora vinacea]WTA65811.1 hypothetical protein OHB51_25410 [Micromonospora sp. NBC_00855]
MTNLEEHMRQASLLGFAARQSAAALVLVRYFGFDQDRKFSPWFEQHREALSQVRALGAHVYRWASAGIEVPTEQFRQVREVVERILESSDPDGPPFETEIVDHLVLATEVFDYLAGPEDLDRLRRVFEHAEELAEAAEDMATDESSSEDAQVAEFRRLEGEIRLLDLSEVRTAQEASDRDPVPLLRSEAFARIYADVIASGYSDEDAGRY